MDELLDLILLEQALSSTGELGDICLTEIRDDFIW